MLKQFISYGNIDITKIDAGGKKSQKKKKNSRFIQASEGTKGVLRTLLRLASRAAYFHICC